MSKVFTVMPTESAAAVLAMARAYEADEDFLDTPFGRALGLGVQALRNVVTHEAAVDAEEELRELWKEKGDT